jgi:diacylglycerol kinase (ATP)
VPLPQHDALEVAILANPAKRRGVAKLVAKLEKTGQVNARVWECALNELPSAAQEAVAAGAHAIVPGGGDGTIFHVLNALDDPPPLLIAPLGSSNDYALELGHRSLDAAVASLVSRETSLHDLCVCTLAAQGGELTRRFCSSAGAGISAAVLVWENRFVPAWLRALIGDAVYPLLALGQCLLAPECELELTLDDETTIEGRGPMVELSKCAITGGLAFTPQAHTTSGDLHSLLVLETSFFRRIHMMLSVLWPRLFHSKALERLDPSRENRWSLGPAKRIGLRATPPMPIHLNGDPVGSTPARFEVRPGALELVGPART